jgi:hypothetical protein
MVITGGGELPHAEMVSEIRTYEHVRTYIGEPGEWPSWSFQIDQQYYISRGINLEYVAFRLYRLSPRNYLSDSLLYCLSRPP